MRGARVDRHAMRGWHLIVVSVFGPVATAYCDAIHDLVPVDNSAVVPGNDSEVPDFNDGSYFTFDLVISILVLQRYEGSTNTAMLIRIPVG
jgi:hypothetical protein